MVLTMLFALLLFVGVVVDVGQAVNRRIALQIVADAGAFTGASSMATGMNWLAKLNGWMRALWAIPVAGTADFTLTICGVDDTANGIYDGLHTPLRAAYRVVNQTFGYRAREEARRVSNYNLLDLFPGEPEWRFSFAEWDPSPEVRISGPRRDVELVASRLVGESKSWWCLEPRRWFWPIRYRSRYYDRYFERSDSRVKYFVWRVQAPPAKALMFDSFFGPYAIPAMKAVAAARPVGGTIKTGDPRYVAELVPVSRVMDGASAFPGLFRAFPLIEDFWYDRRVRLVTH